MGRTSSPVVGAAALAVLAVAAVAADLVVVPLAAPEMPGNLPQLGTAIKFWLLMVRLRFNHQRHWEIVQCLEATITV